jgi:hypothetical protein
MDLAVSVIDTGLTIFYGLLVSLGIVIATIVWIAILAATWFTVGPKAARFIAEYKKASAALDAEEAAKAKEDDFYDPDLDVSNN